jgi:hypothetical protein
MKAMFTHSQMTTSVVAARVARRRINQPTRSHNMQSTFWRTTVAALGTVLASHCALAEKVWLLADQNSGILNQPIYSEPPRVSFSEIWLTPTSATEHMSVISMRRFGSETAMLAG